MAQTRISQALVTASLALPLLMGCAGGDVIGLIPAQHTDDFSLLDVQHELAPGEVSREQLVARLGPPGGVYEQGRLYVYADGDFSGWTTLDASSSSYYLGSLVFLFARFRDDGILADATTEVLERKEGETRLDLCGVAGFCQAEGGRVWRIASGETTAEARRAGTPEGACGVYVYSEGFFTRAVTLDGSNLGPVSGKSFLALSLRPGDHVLEAYFPSAGRTSPDRRDREEFACREGEVLFFAIKSFATFRPSLGPIDAAAGRDRIQEYELLVPFSGAPEPAPKGYLTPER